MRIGALFSKPLKKPALEPAAVAAPKLSGWHKAALRYDVYRMSKDELRELAFDLLASGAISLPDHRLLALDPITRPPHWPDWNRFETWSDAQGRRDWIFEIETRIRKGCPDSAYLAYLESLLSFLRRVEAARQELANEAGAEPSLWRPEVTSPQSQPASA